MCKVLYKTIGILIIYLFTFYVNGKHQDTRHFCCFKCKEKHFLCASEKPDWGKNCSPNVLNVDEGLIRKSMYVIFNDLRNNASRALNASDLRVLEWSPRLQYYSKLWAQSCKANLDSLCKNTESNELLTLYLSVSANDVDNNFRMTKTKLKILVSNAIIEARTNKSFTLPVTEKHILFKGLVSFGCFGIIDQIGESNSTFSLHCLFSSLSKGGKRIFFAKTKFICNSCGNKEHKEACESKRWPFLCNGLEANDSLAGFILLMAVILLFF